MLTSQAPPKPGKVSPHRKRKQTLIVDSSSSDEDVPLASSPAKSTKSRQPNGKVVSSKDRADKKPPKKKAKQALDASLSDEEEKPVLSKKAPRKAHKIKKESPADDVSEDDKPITVAKGRSRVVKGEPSGSDAQKAKKRGRVKKEENLASSPVKGKVKNDEEEEIVFKWWEQDPNGDGSAKWTTLEHFGVIFPPPYEPLPPNVKMKYAGRFFGSLLFAMYLKVSGKSVDLPPEAEEVAGFYAAMLETEHAQDATFNKNFFDDWKKVMKEYPPVCIPNFLTLSAQRVFSGIMSI